MDFSFSEDQLAFRDSVRRFLMTEASPELLRDIWASEVGRSTVLFRRIAEHGLMGLSISECEGGLGLGDVDWSLMTQELGYYAIPGTVPDTAYLAAAVLSGLAEEHPVRRTWLRHILEGTCHVAIGHPLNPLVANAHVADLLLMFDPAATDCVLHAIPRDAVVVTPHRSIDVSRRLASVAWNPTPATRLFDGAGAQAQWDDLLERGALSTSGQLIGLAQRMLDLSVDYAAQRKQFGKPIGSFQAVKHHLADVVTRIEFAKPVLYRAACALALREPRASALVSHAKLVCAEAAWAAARKGIQVHGAMGYTWEVDLQMFMKRAWALNAAWGDRAFHLSRLTDSILLPQQDKAPGPLAIGAGATFTHTL